MRRRRARLGTAAVAAAGALAVWWLSHAVFPYHSLNHDEAVYLQQAAMLLDGQLFLRPPVEDAFHPWFFVVDGERLYPKYAPVPSAMFAAGKLLGGFRIALAGIAAGILALVAGVGRELFDDRTGLVGALFVLASPLFLIDASVFLPYAPTTLLNLTFAYAYLRADREHDRRWAALAGGAVGLAFFARPYTAVLFAAPFVAHACWTLARGWRTALSRQAVTAALGLTGVGTTLGYNAVTTGSPFRFPYEAFAPEDGLGFGHREILAHEIQYTPELAVRANAAVVELFVTEWFAAGTLGVGLAVLGVVLATRRGLTARQAALAGVAGTVVVGNVYFWGNFNILGAVDRPGDGLVNVLGTYYHFDLLVPTGVFAARGLVGGLDRLRPLARDRIGERRTRVALAAVLLVSAGAIGSVAAADLDHRIEENMDATRTYEDAYEPFADGAPADSVVLVPDPYGPWLNHPFQVLRNGAGFDDRTVYALHTRPFAVADAFPGRDLYRYVYRGAWAPYAGSPDHARLQRVEDVSGQRAHLDATVGVPVGAVGVTARLSTDDGRAYYVADSDADALDLRVTVADGEVRLRGDARPVDDGTQPAIPIEGWDGVRLTVFVDQGGGQGSTYRLDLPVKTGGDRVRALTPRIEWCRNARACGGAAAYVPEATPDGVFVRTDLRARNGTGPAERVEGVSR